LTIINYRFIYCVIMITTAPKPRQGIKRFLAVGKLG
jgi:hypothetical protein